MGVEFRLFGGVGAWVDGTRLDLGHARQRGVLAALLVDVNRPVPPDRLVERVWGGRPPLRAGGVLRTYLSRLRKVLGTTAALSHRDGGYVLDADPDDVDLHRFRRLVARARGLDDGPALRALDSALALCRSDVLAGLDTPWADEVRLALGAEQAAAAAHRTDLALRLGQHADLLADLRVRAAADPLDERLAGQLVLALHRAGRTAEALGHYQRTREVLVEQLGVEPGPELRRLHHDVLDPDTAPPATPTARAPRRPPASPPFFTGRDRELAALDLLLGHDGGHTPIAVLTGGGGVGKTWLALRWAHLRHDRFPDGHLHVDLRGFDPVADPLAPDVVVRGFLTALGVRPDAVPAEPDAQSALYRELTADLRSLVVLDNARDTAQVTPLLPGGTSCAVVVTSRHRLTGLVATHGATPVPVDVLDDAQAARLLSRHLGPDRASAEPEAAAGLVRHCAGLPLALGILAARAKSQPDVPLAALWQEVRDDSARLDALDTGELPTNLRAAFTTSVRVLSTGAAELFGLLGLVPSPDLGVTGAAALAGVTVVRARRALRELEEAHLVHQRVPGRYRMHDLVRLHAGELPGDEGAAALERLFDHCCCFASAAADVFTPGEPHRRPPRPPLVGPEVDFPSHRNAIQWLAEERATLVAAAVRGAPRHTAHLSRALARYLDATALFHDALALHTAAVAATGGEDGFALCNLGSVLSRLGRADEAFGHFERGLRHAEATGDLALENFACTLLGIARGDSGAVEESVRHHERALRAARRGGYRHSEGIALLNLGAVHTEQGEHGRARTELEEALAISQEVADPGLCTVVLSALGTLHERLDDPRRAREYHHRALERVEGGVLRTIRLGVLIEAAAAHRTDDPATALEHYRRALDLADRTGYRAEEVRAHEGLAETLTALGRADEAERHAERARALRSAQP
ncbi:BTAD domain-containing putative transcriptional regulator [Saccharothrix sp. Mg75]|uniref:AfsR/SARP family transcriptional regulator n=1 Tax=Saccharothrix sp. Mg75 TaxID=3445357 RepID=UPI003EEAC67A